MRPQELKREPYTLHVGAFGRSDPTRTRRRVAVGLLTFVAALAFTVGVIAAAGPEGDASSPAGPVELIGAEGSTLATLQTAEVTGFTRARTPLPIARRRTVEDGSATVTYRLDEAELRRRLMTAGAQNVAVPERAVASRISTPVVQQQFQNNCETAALSMLLASRGRPRDQVSLQREVRQDGPLDPRTGAEGEMVWGDPEVGYVGRVDGGGTAGGFGVYEQPILALARRWTDPVDLSGQPASAIYDQLLEGRAVLAWIGLQDGPYETWSTPNGGEVTVNYGEHTVLLVGIQGDRLLVNDPLDGQRKWWTKEEFELMYERLDRRAISTA